MFKPYVGDVFGTGGNYMGGMVYLSRLPANDLQFGNKKRGLFGDDAAYGTSPTSRVNSQTPSNVYL